MGTHESHVTRNNMVGTGAITIMLELPSRSYDVLKWIRLTLPGEQLQMAGLGFVDRVAGISTIILLGIGKSGRKRLNNHKHGFLFHETEPTGN